MKLFFSILALCGSLSLCAQVQLTGTVYSATDSLPLPGVSIVLTNSTAGTTSGIDGRFAINIPSGGEVTYRFLGYEEVQKTYTSSSDGLAIYLREGIAMDEVVVTALGLERATRGLGYTVQRLDGRAVSEVPAVNFVDNLTAQLAGVSVSQGATGVGSTAKITIRGEASFTNNNPLFVVDGIPINNSTLVNRTTDAAAGFQEIDFGNGAMDINPADVASVSVLKGPSAAALYGTRASNGVVIINTKDGSSAQRGLQVDFSSTHYVETPFRLPQFQNQYGQGNNGEFAFVDGLGGGVNDNITYSYGPELDQGLLIPQYDSPVTLADGSIVRGGDVAVHGGLPITPTPFASQPDNLRNFYQTGYTTTHTIALANSTDKGHYRLSLTDMSSDSYIPGVNLDRKTVAARMSFAATDRLQISTAVNYMYTSSDNRPASGYGSENINYSLVAWLGRQTAIEPLKDYWQTGLEGRQQYSYNYTFFDNPYFILQENRNSFARNRLFGNIQAAYTFSESLSLTLRSGMDDSSELRRLRRAFSSNRFANGAYAENSVDFREVNTDLLLNYRTTVSDLSLDVSVGANRMNQLSTVQLAQTTSLAQPGIFQLSNAASPIEVFDNTGQKRINSAYGLLKIGYKDYLYIDVTGRNDWSSALATPVSTDNVSFFYPSVSLSYVLSSQVELPSFISFAQLRASFAQVGNDTDPYSTSGAFVPSTPVAGQPTFTDSDILPNTDLVPEQTSALEFGGDFRFADDRVRLDVSYYDARTDNQIIALPIPLSSGYTQQVVNGGLVRNRGLEVIAGITPVANRKWRWDATVNFSTNRATVEELPNEATTLTLAYSRVYDNPNQTVWYQVSEGDRIGDMWGTGYLKDEAGNFIIGEDGRYIVDNALIKLGNYNPDFMVGLTNSVAVGRWQLGFTLDWRQGGVLVSRTQALAGVGGQLAETGFRPEEGIIAEGVTASGEPNTVAISPETYYRQFYDRNHEENNTYDASFLKLRAFSISYDFGVGGVNSLLKTNISKASLALIGRNIFALSEIPHFDPEQLAVQGQNFVSGVEDMSYPTARSIGLSLNLSF